MFALHGDVQITYESQGAIGALAQQGFLQSAWYNSMSMDVIDFSRCYQPYQVVDWQLQKGKHCSAACMPGETRLFVCFADGG